jgi:hypothetical protein
MMKKILMLVVLWIPAFAGMTRVGLGMTVLGTGMTMAVGMAFCGTAFASISVTVAPRDMDDILRRIDQYQKTRGVVLKDKARVRLKDGRLFFASTASTGLEAMVSFTDKSSTVEKHIKLKSASNEYAFKVILDNDGRTFSHIITQINGADALVFFSDQEAIIYTQSTGEDGGIELKEWIYARRPNSPRGSFYRWFFKPEMWQWPLTLELGGQGQVGVFRNMPLSGTPFSDKKRREHVAQVVRKTFEKYKIPVYFPFHEQVAGIPPIIYWNKEGQERQADVRINDDPLETRQDKDEMSKIWSAWESKLQDVFEVMVGARASEYPLLIDP